MRKTFISVILLCLLLVSLTSCQVNWFDKHYEVSWWVIAIPVAVFSLVVFVWEGKHIASKKHICSKCNEEFYPKWWKAAISFHVNDDRVFKCPHCGNKGFCRVSRETED